MTFRWYEVVFAVRCPDPSILDRIATRLPAGAQLCHDRPADVTYSCALEPGGSSPVIHVIGVEDRRDAGVRTIARTSEVDTALDLLIHDAEFRVAVCAPNDAFIHAAVVSWHGRAILFPGHSFAGKSTLAAELVRQGAPYYSDEYAVLATDGRIRPFARPVSLRSGDGRSAGRFTATDLGGAQATEPLPIGTIVVTRYSAAARWSPRIMSRGGVVMALLQHTVDVRARPEQMLARIARAIGDDVIGLEGDRGDATIAARDILDRLTPG